ncbi:hypothetical protein [Mycolicibacterium palauense]|uniref:hypothetical protein n=1 Tax=Mycolicibacterium palauense TaxID=2034511 RepID=UPI000BFF0BAF|nr:hypothetical protein [Mycolicibacterium palauense]
MNAVNPYYDEQRYNEINDQAALDEFDETSGYAGHDDHAHAQMVPENDEDAPERWERVPNREQIRGVMRGVPQIRRSRIRRRVARLRKKHQ